MTKYLIITEDEAKRIIKENNLNDNDSKCFQEINKANARKLLKSEDKSVVLAEAELEIDEYEHALEYCDESQIKELFFEKNPSLKMNELEDIFDSIEGLSLRQTMALAEFMENLKNI